MRRNILKVVGAVGAACLLLAGCAGTSGSGTQVKSTSKSTTPSGASSASCDDPTTGCSLPSADTDPCDPTTGINCAPSELPSDPDADDPANDDPTDSAPSAYDVGDSLSLTQTSADDDSTESSGTVRVTKAFAARSEPTEYGSDSEHGVFVVLRVTITCEDGSLEYNPLDFYLASNAGDHYEDTTYSDAWGAPLSSGTLHTGERVRGTLVYDVPRSAQKGKLYFAPNLGDDPLGYWKYSVHS